MCSRNSAAAARFASHALKIDQICQPLFNSRTNALAQCHTASLSRELATRTDCPDRASTARREQRSARTRSAGGAMAGARRRPPLERARQHNSQVLAQRASQRHVPQRLPRTFPSTRNTQRAPARRRREGATAHDTDSIRLPASTHGCDNLRRRGARRRHADATEEPEEKAQDPPPLSRQQSFLQGVPHSPQGGCCALFLDSHAVYHGLEDDPDEPTYRPTSLAQKLFLILEDPNYNCTAQLVSIVILLLIVLGCITYVMESMRAFQYVKDRCDRLGPEGRENVNQSQSPSSSRSKPSVLACSRWNTSYELCSWE